MTDVYGNLLAITGGTCERYLVQIRNGHGRKNASEFASLKEASLEADRLIGCGWSVAIIRRADTLVDLLGQDPPRVHKFSEF
jgi:hypothetical protein